ncbi:hypothetical protein [Deinococcus sonorensis]|uniref:DUF3137 domain-containing protein n=2 Tax=Deinococcus sonorensis TaxID=309891 RepID=A0AAU7UG97_9DEIO
MVSGHYRRTKSGGSAWVRPHLRGFGSTPQGSTAEDALGLLGGFAFVLLIFGVSQLCLGLPDRVLLGVLATSLGLAGLGACIVPLLPKPSTRLRSGGKQEAIDVDLPALNALTVNLVPALQQVMDQNAFLKFDISGDFCWYWDKVEHLEVRDTAEFPYLPAGGQVATIRMEEAWVLFLPHGIAVHRSMADRVYGDTTERIECVHYQWIPYEQSYICPLATLDAEFKPALVSRTPLDWSERPKGKWVDSRKWYGISMGNAQLLQNASVKIMNGDVPSLARLAVVLNLLIGEDYAARKYMEEHRAALALPRLSFAFDE